MPGSKDKKNRKYIADLVKNINTYGSDEIKEITGFMTDGSWEKADLNTKKKTLSDYMLYQAIQHGGAKEDNPYIQNVQSQPVMELTDIMAEQIKDGVDCFILVNSFLMDQIAFPGLDEGEPLDNKQVNIDDLLADVVDQKNLIQEVANGKAASEAVSEFVMKQKELAKQMEKHALEQDEFEDDMEDNYASPEDYLYGGKNIDDLIGTMEGYEDEEELENEKEPGKNPEKESGKEIKIENEKEPGKNPEKEPGEEIKPENNKEPGKEMKIENDKEPEIKNEQNQPPQKEKEKKGYFNLSSGSAVTYQYIAPEKPAFFKGEGFNEKKGRISDLQQYCNQIITDAENKRRPYRVKESDAEKMADLVVAKALLSRNASRRGGILYADKMDPSFVKDMDNVNARAVAMRKRILMDPVFRTELKKGRTSTDFFERYSKAKKAELAFLTCTDMQGAAADKYADLPVQLTEKQQKIIKQLYKQLDEVNEHKLREGLNADLVTALSTVDNNSRLNHNLTFGDLVNLNRAAAEYYANRKGILFGPLTDAGKDRLEIAGNVFEMTKKIVDKVILTQRDIEMQNEAEKQKEVENAKQQNAKKEENKKAEDLAKYNDKIYAENQSVYNKMQTGLNDRMKNGLKDNEKNLNAVIKYAAMAYACECYKDEPRKRDNGGYEEKLRFASSKINDDPAFRKAIGEELLKEPFDIKKVVEKVTARDENGKLKITKDMEEIRKEEQKKIEENRKNKGKVMGNN